MGKRTRLKSPVFTRCNAPQSRARRWSSVSPARTVSSTPICACLERPELRRRAVALHLREAAHGTRGGHARQRRGHSEAQDRGTSPSSRSSPGPGARQGSPMLLRNDVCNRSDRRFRPGDGNLPAVCHSKYRPYCIQVSILELLVVSCDGTKNVC